MQSTSVYTDFQSLAALHGINGPGEARRIDDVAGQFASVFTHMMLKSMRQASLGEGVFDSQQSLFYRDMYDQQLALSLSESDGVGIKQMIADHLRNVTGIQRPDEPVAAAEGRRGRAAYAAVAAMSAENETQESAAAADTGVSRNAAQPEPVEGLRLNWRGRQ
jgi:flagellar protein FlgJ